VFVEVERGRLTHSVVLQGRKESFGRRDARNLYYDHWRTGPSWYRCADLPVAVVIAVAGLALEARIAAGAGTRVICAGNGRTLAASLACGVAKDCCGLISFGVAGGLSPQLHTGTCVVGSAILSGTTRFMTDRGWSRNLLQTIPSAVYGIILGVPAPIARPEAKRALHVNTGAMAVDMESHVVAHVAAARGLPMAAVRVITDSASQGLPHAALVAMRADGTVDLAGMIRSMMREPGELPMLLRTGFDALVGLAVLLRGRQLLGPRFCLPD
jgi:adenosylhomocysteine nucleosidase